MAKFKLFKNKKESGKEDMAMCSCGNMCKVSDIEAKKSAEVAQQQVTEESQHNSETSVKVLGSGCKKCNDLETATLSALTNLGMDTNIEHVTDFAQIASYGVMSTPALVVDGKVLSYGKLLKVEEIEALLKSARP